MRYIAILTSGDADLEPPTLESRARNIFDNSLDWSSPLSCGSFRIWLHRDNPPTDLKTFTSFSDFDGKAIALLGFALQKSDDEIDPPIVFNHNIAHAVSSTAGKWLLHKAWGQYLAFVFNPSLREHSIVRDPTGAVPCYFHNSSTGTLFFSDRQDAQPLLPAPSLNKDYFLETMLNARIDKSQTGLMGINEVLPGEIWKKLTITEGRHIGWRPYDFMIYNKSDINCRNYADLLRNSLTKSAASLAARYEHILVPIGGLDSSIILSCLSKGPTRPKISLFTYFTNDAAGNETHYTQDVADYFGLKLDKIFLDPNNIDFCRVMTSNRQPKAERIFDFGDQAASPLKFGRYESGEAVFTGVGGDTILFQSAGSLPMWDHVHHNGIDRNSLTVLKNTMRGSQQSVLRIIHSSLLQKIYKSSGNDIIKEFIMGSYDDRWFNNIYTDGRDPLSFINPGLLSNEIFPRGSILHMLLNCYMTMPPRNPLNDFGHLPHHHIFWTQPIIETCLAIPSWILNCEGKDRGLARQAFSRHLPDTMLRRYSKGTPSLMYQQFLANNHNKITSILRDGIGSSIGIYSDKLNNILREPEGIFDIPNFVALHALNMESWAQSF
jgi:asparagine synthase (glutamine-hydrolysing)